MTEPRPISPAVYASIRTPRAAAVAGIAFAVLLGTALVLVGLAVPRDPADAGTWITDESRRAAVVFALNLTPFAAVAFLWFIGVVRTRVGDREDRLFSSVFLGSGLLFIALLLAAAAVTAGLLGATSDDAELAPEVWSFGRRSVHTLLTLYAMRIAAVFMLSTTTMLTRLHLAPRWLAVLGYGSGILLLVTLGAMPWIQLVFPAWVLVLSIHILVVSNRAQ